MFRLGSDGSSGGTGRAGITHGASGRGIAGSGQFAPQESNGVVRSAHRSSFRIELLQSRGALGHRGGFLGGKARTLQLQGGRPLVKGHCISQLPLYPVYHTGHNPRHRNARHEPLKC